MFNSVLFNSVTIHSIQLHFHVTHETRQDNKQSQNLGLHCALLGSLSDLVPNPDGAPLILI